MYNARILAWRIRARLLTPNMSITLKITCADNDAFYWLDALLNVFSV